MVAVTGDGTTFGCAAISLSEAGMAVLEESGSRLGFVPYDSLGYVVPAADVETGTAMTVSTTNGSAFSCAAISQTSSGVAALDASGGRVGFVPYETLQYVLPEGKAGDSLPADCSLPTGVTGVTAGRCGADESEELVPEDGAEASADEEGASGDQGPDENDEASSDEANTDEENEGVWEEAKADGDTAADANASTSAGDSQQADREEAGESEMQVEWSFGEYDE
jgi:hypothetical protein